MICRFVKTLSLIFFLTLVSCQQEVAVTKSDPNSIGTSDLITSPSTIVSVNPQMPPPRKQADMVYDSKRQVIILFGGEDEEGNLLGDTWEYDGEEWRNIKTSEAPSARSMHVMAYDSIRNNVVLFGGYTTQLDYNNDTWIYDGVTWQEVEGKIAPPPRHSSALVFDIQQGMTVLFGGYAKGGQQQDFWLFDAHSWLEATTLSTAPPLSFPKMIYDTSHDNLVIQAFGNQGTYQLNFSDLQNTNRINSFTKSPFLGSIFGYDMVYDLGRSKTVLFGGESGSREVPHWEFDGKDWYQVISDVTPSGRLFHAMAYDEVREVIVLFGGMNSAGTLLNDIWEYDGNTWIQR